MSNSEEQEKKKPAFLSNQDMNYEILNQEDKYFPNAGFAVHFKDLIQLIEKNGLTGDKSDKNQYITGIISKIDNDIRESKLFKHISNYLYSKKDLFSEFGNIFLLAEKYTYDFYNYGVIEDDLEAISINNPILNGLSLFIEDYMSNDGINSPDDMYQYFFKKPVDDLIKIGQKILGIEKNDELKYESLEFKMNNSMAIAYKFKAKLAFNNEDIIKQFAQTIPDGQQLNTFENTMLNLLGKSIFESTQDYRANLIKLINLKGFYYHLFILKIAQKFKENISPESSSVYTPHLSTIYHLLNYFDEPYIKILDFTFISERIFDKTSEKFEKHLHLIMNK